MPNWIISIIVSGAVLGVAATFVVSEVKGWKFAGAQHAQNLAALFGQAAKEALLLAAAQGWAIGSDAHIRNAVGIFQDKMAAAGYQVTVENATAQVNIAHQDMTLSNETKYNDPAPAAEAAEVKS